jgi:hypothetical protein
MTFMKKIFLIFFSIIWALVANAQIITTVAGNGSTANTGDGGIAVTASIGYPVGCAFDTRGNFYFGDVLGNVVRKVTPCGIISTVAGTGIGGYNGDGILATTAELNDPGGFALDSLDNLYIADVFNNRIRKIDVITGIITTVAGNGGQGFSGDGGPATSATLYQPCNICFNQSGSLYIVDGGNHRIRKVDTSGAISTVVGTGTAGHTGDNGLASAAEIEDLYGICADTLGNIYFEQQDSNTIRKVNTVGVITTIAGNGSTGSGSTGDGGQAINARLDPLGLTFDKSGNLYISGYIENNIRKINTLGIISTVAGNGIAGFSGDGGTADSAELYDPYGIAIDPYDNLYIADRNNSRIRKITFNPSPPCSSTEVNNITPIQGINIYPNPAYNTITITAGTQIKSVAVINLLGQTVYSQTYNSEQVQVSVANLPAGVYFVKVNEGYVQKIVKE